MPEVGIALSAFFSSAAASSIGTFLTTNIWGRLLTSVALSALKAAIAGKPSSQQSGIRTQQTQTGGITPASFILGQYATEGQLLAPPMSHGKDGKTPNAYLTYVIELGDIPGQQLTGVILDGERADIDGEAHADYGMPIGGRFTGHAWVKYHDGSQTVADPMLLDKYGEDPDRPWSADMIGAGLCYAILTFRFNREIFSGFPKVRFEMTGIPLYDPRKDSTVGGSGSHRWADRSTWEPSENVGVQAYNIHRGIDLGGGNVWGGAAEAEDLPLSVWWAEMNKADFGVALAGGGTEPQWRSSYEVFVDDEPATVLEDLMRGCSGRSVENGGIFKIRLGGPGLPLYFFTDEDVILTEPEENMPFNAGRVAYNGVQVTYPDPSALWEPKDAPALYNATYEAEDGGQRRVADLTLPATPYPTQVQRVQRAYNQDERRFRQHVLNLPPDACMLEPLDVASWTSAENGYIAKDWEVSSQSDPLTSGTAQFRLREVDPDDYDWSPAFQLPIDYANINRTPLAEQPVAGFGFTAVVILDEDGDERRPGLEFAFDGDEQDDVRGFLWEIRLWDTEDAVLRGSTADITPGSLRVFDGVLPNTRYEGRGRWVVDRPTRWTDWFEATTDDVLIGEKDIGETVWERNRRELEEALARATENFDLIVDTLAEFDLNARVTQVLEDARVEGVVEEVRETLTAELDDTSASIEEINTTAVTDRAAVAQLEATLTTAIGNVSGEVSTVATSLSTLDGQFSSYQATVAGQFAAQTAYVNQTFYTKTTVDQNIAGAIQSVNTTVGNLSATVTDVSGSIDGLKAVRAVSINNNGVFTGWALNSQLINGTVVSDMIFNVNNFYVTDSSTGAIKKAPFVITGGVVYAEDLVARRANIENLAVDTFKLAGNSVTSADFVIGGAKTGNGSLQLAAVADARVPGNTTADIFISVTFEQSYSAPRQWGYKIEGGFGFTPEVFRERTGMVAQNDAPTITYFKVGVVNSLSTAQFYRIDVYWWGQDANIGMPSVSLSVIARFK